MGLLHRLFSLLTKTSGSSAQTQKKSDSSKTVSKPPSRPTFYFGEDVALTDAELEVLSRISLRTQNEIPEYWEPFVGSIASTINKFFDMSLIKEATVGCKIDKYLTVKDLKTILKNNNLKQSGRKGELIERIISDIGEDKARRLIPDDVVYITTEKGIRTIKQYKFVKDKAYSDMKTAAAESLRNGNVKQAGAIVTEYERSQIFPRGLNTNWDRGIPDETIEEARLLLEYPYDDLDIDRTIKNEIAIIISLSVLTGDVWDKTADKLLDIFGGSVPCPDLIACDKSQIRHVFLNSPEDDTHMLMSLYVKTTILRIKNRIRLKIYTSGENKAKKIKITNYGKPCPICDIKKKVYRLSELDQLPELPLHWGCSCEYVDVWRD